MNRAFTLAGLIGAAIMLPALASAGLAGTNDGAGAVLQQSFTAKGQAGMDRLDQDDVQRLCSRAPDGPALSEKEYAEIMASQEASVRYPADGQYLGDWRAGEKIAQNGKGFQSSDDPAQPSGGNCYACHQLARGEVAYGTIGPSLYLYGKLRGNAAETQRYTYAKIYNSNAFLPCSSMPRFGHKGILDEQQIKDVVALLLDPQSPVNAE